MKNFESMYVRELPELNAKATLYRHRTTGARVLSMETDDVNKCFGISFRTPPKNSTGVAHILEHTVLCGSRKYPVKDPFVQLLKGSLQTFLNAFTYPDKTCYPVASQNLKDFHNLVDVYLDSVFHPLIAEDFFMQEGWHYEMAEPEADLTIKGVVYNEMKGVYSSPDALLGELSQQSLFPDVTYGFDSGGDPRRIPDLTYDDFRAFHASHYHPSNAYVFFYGDDPVEDRLRLLGAYLDAYRPIDLDSGIELQRSRPPVRIEKPFAVSPDDPSPKPMFTVNWMLSEPLSAESVYPLQLLDRILLETPASPLRRALVESGLGEDLAGGGLETHLRQTTFSVGLKGVKPENLAKAEALVFETLERLAGEGIEREDVDAALNSFEFDLRENNTGGFPQGLSIMLRALNTWIYDADPLELVAFEQPLTNLKQQAKRKGFFENLLRKCFLENRHRSVVVLKPDAGLAEREEKRETRRLAAVKAAMTPAQREDVVHTTRRLLELQSAPDRPEDLAKIPLLSRKDLDPKIKTVERRTSRLDEATVVAHPLHVNGILYLDVGLDLHALEPDELPLASILAGALLEMGTEKEDYVALSQRIAKTTGGIYASPFLSAIEGSNGGIGRLLLHAKCMLPQTRATLDILRDVLLRPDLANRERFRQIVLETKAEMEAALVPNGHRAVMTRLRARYDGALAAAERMSGVDALFFARRLAEAIESDWPSVQRRLERIRAKLVNRKALTINLTVDPDALPASLDAVREFVDDLPSGALESPAWQPADLPKIEALLAPTQVNFVGCAGNLYETGYALHGSALVVPGYLRTAWLWEKIRVRGGAYGGLCAFDQWSGTFVFASYRDPNLERTLETYKATADYLKNLKLSADELTRAIIGAIGSLDAYRLPDARGRADLHRFLLGYDDATRQKLRDQALSTTVEDFRAFGEALSAAFSDPAVSVICSPEAAKTAGIARRTRVL